MKPAAEKADAPAAPDQPGPEKAPKEKAQPKHWTVTELTSRIKGVLEPAFSEIWLQGEVSNARPAASGHLYFSLKDENACISAAMFSRGNRKAVPFNLTDGLHVLCRGKISVYAPRGNYQFIVEHMEPMGSGALQLAFEQLKAKLAAEGLFDAKRKRPLPAFPKRLAIVTSPSGAAIRDMLNILRRRAPHLEVIVIPAVVQGDDAPRQLIRGIEAANACDLGDVLIVTRGGGSIEDLWCFNDEGLARAIAKSRIPVVSAVGHEIDFTISDFVSDLRAPTPSAAAEIVTGNWVDMARQIDFARDRMRSFVTRDLSGKKNLLSHLSARLVSPQDRLRDQSQRVDDLTLRMERALRNRLDKRSLALGQIAGKLEALSPLRVLERGYTLVKRSGDGIIRSRSALKPGERITVTFHDGNIEAEVLGNP